MSCNLFAVNKNCCDLVNCTEIDKHSALIKAFWNFKFSLINQKFTGFKRSVNTRKIRLRRKRHANIVPKHFVITIRHTVKSTFPHSVKTYIAVTNELRPWIFAKRIIFIKPFTPFSKQHIYPSLIILPFLI